MYKGYLTSALILTCILSTACEEGRIIKDDASSSSLTSSSASAESTSSASSSNSAPALTGLVINEAVPNATDENYLEGNDWFELYNAGPEPVQLNQYFIQDSNSELVALPPLTLAAGEYAVVAAVDADTMNPPVLSVPFKLGSTDQLQLYFGTEWVAELLWTETEVKAGTGFGLVAGIAVTTLPTPGAKNQAAPRPPEPSGNSDVVISEVVTKSDSPSYLAGNDWIELFNAGAEPINLSQFTLADSGNAPAPLPDYNLSAGEYWVIAAVDSEDAAPPSPNVPFKLGGSDWVRLYLADELVAELSWAEGQADQGYGFGWVGNRAVTTEPTPGRVNIAAEIATPTGDTNLRINEVVTKSAMPNYLAGNDWIELYNAGSEPVLLSDFALADDNREPQPLPAITLAPGAYWVVAAIDDDSNPPSPSVPFKLGSADEVALYKNGALVSVLSWQDGDTPEGSSYGWLNSQNQTLTPPTPGSANQ